MDWDLGIRGLGLLMAMSIGFGLIGQLLAWRLTPHWLWLAATLIYFMSGLFVSEVWFGWATEEDLQPNIDGLSFDEVLLALVPRDCGGSGHQTPRRAAPIASNRAGAMADVATADRRSPTMEDHRPRCEVSPSLRLRSEVSIRVTSWQQRGGR
jgi:hypothetical protein